MIPSRDERMTHEAKSEDRGVRVGQLRRTSPWRSSTSGKLVSTLEKGTNKQSTQQGPKYFCPPSEAVLSLCSDPSTQGSAEGSMSRAWRCCGPGKGRPMQRSNSASKIHAKRKDYHGHDRARGARRCRSDGNGLDLSCSDNAHTEQNCKWESFANGESQCPARAEKNAAHGTVMKTNPEREASLLINGRIGYSYTMTGKPAREISACQQRRVGGAGMIYEDHSSGDYWSHRRPILRKGEVENAEPSLEAMGLMGNSRLDWIRHRSCQDLTYLDDLGDRGVERAKPNVEPDLDTSGSSMQSLNFAGSHGNHDSLGQESNHRRNNSALDYLRSNRCHSLHQRDKGENLRGGMTQGMKSDFEQHGSKKRSTTDSGGSRGSGSSGEVNGNGTARREVIPQNLRQARSDGFFEGKSGSKLSRQVCVKQQAPNDLLRSRNSQVSSDIPTNSKSERGEKLGRMSKNRNKSFHDSLKGGESNESEGDFLTSKTGAAVMPSKEMAESGRQESGKQTGVSNSCARSQSDTATEEWHGGGLSGGVIRYLSDSSSRSIQSCKTMLETTHFESRDTVKNSVVRSLSLIDNRRVRGQKVVRSFSIRGTVGFFHRYHNRHAYDDNEDAAKDDIISYSSDEDGAENDANDGETSVDDVVGRRIMNISNSHGQEVTCKSFASGALRLREMATRPVHKVVPDRAFSSSLGRSTSSCGDGAHDGISIQTDTTDGSGSEEIWDEFESAMVDSDSRSSGSDCSGDPLFSGSGRIFIWADKSNEDERTAYLDPSMSPRVPSSTRKSKKEAVNVESILAAATNSSVIRSKGYSHGQSPAKGTSLLGGFGTEEDDAFTDNVGSSGECGLSQEDFRKGKRSLKKKKSRLDVPRNTTDKFDWESKAKEDKKRENKKKKKEADDDTPSSFDKFALKGGKVTTATCDDTQTEIAKRGGHFGRAKMKRASSMIGFSEANCTGKKIQSRCPHEGKLRRSLSHDVEESNRETMKEVKRSSMESSEETQSSLAYNEEARNAAKPERKRRTSTVGFEQKGNSRSKSGPRRGSRCPSSLSLLYPSTDDPRQPEVKHSRRRSLEKRTFDVDLSRSKIPDEREMKAHANFSKSRSKGLRRTKSLCAPVVSVKAIKKGRDEPTAQKARCTSVKRSSSTRNMKKCAEEAIRGDKSRSKKKKRADGSDSKLQQYEFQQLLEVNPKVACGLIERDPLIAEVRDKNGCLPLHLAAYKDLQAEVFQKLIEAYPAACESQCDKGFTPLHFAVEADIPTSKIKMLIKASPRALKTQDRKGQVPLHVAVSQNARLSSIRLLVFIYPESVDIETVKGDTARKIAKRKKSGQEVLNELRSLKA